MQCVYVCLCTQKHVWRRGRVRCWPWPCLRQQCPPNCRVPLLTTCMFTCENQMGGGGGSAPHLGLSNYRRDSARSQGFVPVGSVELYLPSPLARRWPGTGCARTSALIAYRNTFFTSLWQTFIGTCTPACVLCPGRQQLKCQILPPDLSGCLMT